MRKAFLLIAMVMFLLPACDKSNAQSSPRTPAELCNDMWQHYVAVGNIMQTHYRNCDTALNQLFAYTNKHQEELKRLRKEADETFAKMRAENNIDPAFYQLKQNIQQSFNKIEYRFQNFCFNEGAMFRKEFRLW